MILFFFIPYDIVLECIGSILLIPAPPIQSLQPFVRCLHPKVFYHSNLLSCYKRFGLNGSDSHDGFAPQKKSRE